MASTKKPIKRRLPKWMETVHSQPEKVKISSPISSASCSDAGFSDYKADCCKGTNNTSEDTHEFTCIFDKHGTNKKVEHGDKPDGKITKMSCNSKASYTSKSVTNDGGLPKLSVAQDAIAQSMPLLAFKGTTIYSYQDSDCACLCEDILSSLSESGKTVFGFDMEWPVSFRRGSSEKTTLIQMCPSENECYLFHISAMLSFPKSLKRLILDPRLILTGLNIESDLWKLERDFDIRVKPLIDRGSVVDVGVQANRKLKSTERWALEGLCRNVLKRRLDKDAELRCGDWTEVPLNKQQKLYAATDAYAGLLLYKHLVNGETAVL